MENNALKRTPLQSRKNHPPIKSKPPVRTAVKEWASTHHIDDTATEELLNFLPVINTVMIRKDLLAPTNSSPCKRKESALLDEGDVVETSSSKSSKRSKPAPREDSPSETPAKSEVEQLKHAIEQKLECFFLALTSKIDLMNQKLDALSIRANKSLASREAKINESAKMITSLREEFLAFKKAFKPSTTTSTTLTSLEITSKLPPFPVGSIPELQALEQVLEDEEQQQIFVKTLSKIGGSRDATIVNSIMRFIMTKDVVMRFSLRGKFGKHSLDKLRIYKCIMESLRQNRKLQSLADHDLNLIIGSYLAQSSYRRGRQGCNTSSDELGQPSSPRSPLPADGLDFDDFVQSPSSPLSAAAIPENPSKIEAD